MTSSSEIASDSICVFVSSSDRTRDVFLRAFAHFDRMWPTCPFPRYVGLTSHPLNDRIHGFTVVTSKGESRWAQELADQIRALPPYLEFVVLLLDDFLLLKPVQAQELEQLLRDAVRLDLPYLRLKPADRSWVVSALRRAGAILSSRRFSRLSRTEPYYSSLQASLWERQHLLECLENAGSIWQFEHIVPTGSAHWTVTRPVLNYRHVVEKAVWQGYAPLLFRRIGLTFHPGDRPMSSTRGLLRFYWTKAKFGVIGFGWVRLKRFFLSKPLVPPRDARRHNVNP